MRPLVVLVSGAPGSGKSTLARNLAEYMKLPHIERDRIFSGMDVTYGKKVDRAANMPVYYNHLVRMIDDRVSFVTDGTLYRDVSEEDVKKYLVPNAVVVNVHVRAHDSHQRFYDREMKREGWSSDWVESHMPQLEKIYPDTVDPLELGVDCIEVDANDGYQPAIEEIVENIRERYTAAVSAVKEPA